MVDAQSICVGQRRPTNWATKALFFRFVFWHSIALGAIVGIIVMVYAYVLPQFVPHGLTFIH